MANSFIVSSQEAMLAMSYALINDICFRTDIDRTFILTALPSTAFENWALFAPSSATSGVKPDVSNGIQYVTQDGEDSNDGLSLGSAKLTIMAAYAALPIYGGTIYICSGYSSILANTTNGELSGIWIAGPADPNYNNLPAGWTQAKEGAVSFIGIPGYIGNPNSVSNPAVSITGANDSVPQVWLSGVSSYFFQNLGFRGVRLNVTTTGDRTGDVVVMSDIVFDNCYSEGNIFGPSVDIAGNVLWARFTNCGMQVNSSAAAGTDARAAILVKTDNGNGSGLIYVENCVFIGGGGVRFSNDQANSGSITVKNCSMEGSGTTSPLFEVVSPVGNMSASIEVNGGISDSGENPPLIRIPATLPPQLVVVSGVNGDYIVDGPCTIVSPMVVPAVALCTVNNIPLKQVSPQAQAQLGAPFGKSLYQTDVHRRTFAPTNVRFANLAATLPGSWESFSGTDVVITPVTGPDGSQNAAAIISSGDGNYDTGVSFYSQDLALALGDYIYIGCWVKPNTPAISAEAYSLCVRLYTNVGLQLLNGSYLTSISNGAGTISCAYCPQTDGDWQWIWGVAKVISSPTIATVSFISLAQEAYGGGSYFAPTLVQIPASAVALTAVTTIAASGGATQSGHICTITTIETHGFAPGQSVIVNVTGSGGSGYNGLQVIYQTPTTNTFTFYNSTTGLSSTGGGSVIPGNDSEVADWAMNAAAFPDGVVAGATLATLKGQSLFIGGTLIQPFSSPTSSGTGIAGQFTYDENYLYVCTATNTWKRVALIGGY